MQFAHLYILIFVLFYINKKILSVPRVNSGWDVQRYEDFPLSLLLQKEEKSGECDFDVIDGRDFPVRKFVRDYLSVARPVVIIHAHIYFVSIYQ